MPDFISLHLFCDIVGDISP